MNRTLLSHQWTSVELSTFLLNYLTGVNNNNRACGMFIAMLSGGIGVASAFAAAYFEWVAKNGRASLWIAAAIAFFVASYRLWAAERRRFLNLNEERLTEVREYLDSGLVIDYRPNESVFFQGHTPITQYRVSVRSLKDVPNVELVVNHLKIEDSPAYHNLHLRPMFDRDTQQGTKRVKLHARKERVMFESWV